MGQKGVGKSTMILQHIKKFYNLEETLYVTADNIYFARNSQDFQQIIPKIFNHTQI
ncbi:MAG: hypothetical protein E7125_00110 [Bacteroidales bacterium]|nr:hypothetical protein [Bacteroidales bacterium]